MTVKRKNPDALKNLATRLKSLAGKEIAIGYPADKAVSYPDGTPVVEVAASHVFGVGVPVRDFMALAKPRIMEGAKDYMAAAAKLVGAPPTASSVQAVKQIFDEVGMMGVQEIQSAIVDGSWAPLSINPMSQELRERVSKSWGINIPPGMSYSAAKQKYKGSIKPLVDTGLMVASTTFTVRDKKA